jgi:16S rRNA (guanine527-N7)-methyltransferase
MSKVVFNATHAQTLLSEGLGELALTLPETHTQKLIDYLALMAKWNPVYNLTAIRETDKMVSHHLLDSLAILNPLQQWLNDAGINAPRILDVGTGGGLPGIVLAIMRPDWSLTLIDPVHKKTAFLQQVKSQLTLTNVNIVTGKVEDLPDGTTYDVITSRAFASVVDFVRLSEKALAPNGFFAAMKGVFPDDEMADLNITFENQWQATSVALKVPQLDAQRHLIQLKQTNTKGRV